MGICYACFGGAKTSPVCSETHFLMGVYVRLALKGYESSNKQRYQKGRWHLRTMKASHGSKRSK